MAGAIEPFANISAQELLEHGISCHGWVRKKDTSHFSTLFRGDWPRRFMILHTGYLYLYKDADSKDISEKIPLKEYSVCDAQEVSKYKWTFKLIHESYGGKTLFFAVDSKLDLKTWQDCITDKKDIYWPILPPAHKTQGDLPVSHQSETNPSQQSRAPLPGPDPVYVNVDYNPRLNFSTASTTVSTQSRPAPSARTLPPRTGPLVPRPHRDPKIKEPPMQPRSVPSVQPHPHPSALGSSAQSLPRASVLGPKQKGPTTMPRPVVSAQKAPHGRHIMTPSLPKSSSETCLTKPGYDNAVKELTCRPSCFLEEGALPPRTSPSVSSGPNHDPKTREPPMQPRSIADVRGLHHKPKPEGPSVQHRPHHAALGSSAQSLPRASVAGTKPKGPSTMPSPVASVQTAPHGRHIMKPSQMRLPKSFSETCLTKPGYDNVVKELTGTPLSFFKEGGNESGKDNSLATAKENEGKFKAVGTVNYEGGVVVAEDVQVICPYGAIDKEDNHLTIEITLEKPFAHYDMIVKNGLENDVIFIAPVINLLPNGQVFKQSVTVTTKLTIGKEASLGDVLILHGVQARDAKIFWQDITQMSKIDLEKKEMKVEIEGFSRIAALLRLTSILTKNIITRLNLIGFNYTLSVLFKDNHPYTPFGELALVFMSHDVYRESCFREHPSSALMQLKENGFEELCSTDRLESNRIYNSESLKVSVLLGKDYKLTDGQLESIDFIVESSTWWSTGHVVKLSLKGTDGVRILCGRIGIEGQYGHRLLETFCELDRCGYVRRLLRVEGSILNLVPMAQKLDVSEEAINEAIKTWRDDEEQLKVILQHVHWSKEENDGCKGDPAVLRNALQGLNPEVCEVDERGKMHINHLRELAFEIQGLNHEDPHLMEYFTNQIRTLCDSILKDCCIEMDAEVSIENCSRFLYYRERITEDVALKLEKICSPSTRSIHEDFFSVVPFLIQAIKEIFRKESPLVVQNGLKGLPKETVSKLNYNVRVAFSNRDILRLVYEVCRVLEKLCLNNCEKHSTEMIESWSESLGIWNMSNFLAGFFQSCQDNKLHKRLELFSRSLRRISEDIGDIKEIEMRYFYNVALNLIKFAAFDPSKLVKFEIIDSANSQISCYCEAIKYDWPHDTYSQQFEIRKESEDELQLGAIAHVHLDGRIRKVGAFESVITLPPSSVEELARCPMTTLPVTVKQESTDSRNLRVVLSSTRRKNISEALSLLQRDLGDDILDWKQVEITESYLAVCCFVEWVGVVRIRLLYKWRSEAISVDSKDFVAIAESSVANAYKSASDSDASSPFKADLAALSIASHPVDKIGNFVMDPLAMELIQRRSLQQCGRLELHLHQTIMKGHVCVAGDNTRLHTEMSNTAQRCHSVPKNWFIRLLSAPSCHPSYFLQTGIVSFPQEGLCAPSQKSLTAGPSSNDAAVSKQESNESRTEHI